MSGTILKSNCKELIFWKIAYSITNTILLHLAFMITFLFVVNINIFNPLQWMKITLLTLTSLNTWICFCIFAMVIFAFGMICSKDYLVEIPYKTNRVLKFFGYFTFRNCLLAVFHLLCGGLTVCLTLTVFDANLFGKCAENGYCFNDHVFLLFLNGFWIGIYYFLTNLSEDKILKFPVIQQRKLLTIKSSLSVLFKQALRQSIWPTIYFLIFYYLQIFQIRDLTDEELKSKSLTLLNSSTIFLCMCCFLISTVFMSEMLCLRFFLEVFLTERLIFPIESEFSQVLTLKEALATNKIPIIQHLACYDFYLLSIWDPIRRQQLYTLSQPGGHAHNWNNLLQEIIKLITNFSDNIYKLTEMNFQPESKKKEIPLQPDFKYPSNIPEYYQFPAQSPTRLRNMSLPRQEPIGVNVTQTNALIESIDNIKLSILNRFEQFVTAFKKKSLIQYFFGDLPESRIHFLLVRGQPVIWAMQGLSFMVTASFTEDQYGVIQKDLPVILTTLVQLKQNLDKLNKERKSTRNDLLKMQLTSALRTAVKRSLYNISNTFGDYFDQIKLTREVSQQLQMFVTYKEC